MTSYEEVSDGLRKAYDRAAEERERKEATAWKLRERQAFLALLQREDKKTLLEIGAGPGWDSLFFQVNGLTVVSTDLSPEMVRLCRAKGLEAYERDFLDLGFEDGGFAAVYARNCLLHVPRKSLGDALQEIKRVMAPGGLFFYGVYGGIERNGPWEEDKYIPKRHFTLYTDEQIKAIATSVFALRDFKTIQVRDTRNKGIHFQRLICQRSED